MDIENRVEAHLDSAEAIKRLDKFKELLVGLPELSSHIDKKILIKNIIEHAKRLVNADHIHVRVRDWLEDKLVLEEYVEKENIEPEHPKFFSISVDKAIGGRVLRTLESQIVPDVQNDPDFKNYMKDIEEHREYIKNIKGPLFSWEDIPENCEEKDKLKEFLMQNYDVNWVSRAKIKKTDNSMAINIYTENNSLSLKLNDEKTKAILTIDGSRTYEFIAKIEDGKLNICLENDGEEKVQRLIDFLKSFEHAIVVPLRLDKKAVGVLSAVWLKKTEDIKLSSSFTDEANTYKIILEYFANQATVALRNAWLFEATTWQPQPSESFTVETLCREVVKEAIKRTGARDGRVRFVDWKMQNLVPGALLWPNGTERDQRICIRKIGICPAGVSFKEKKISLIPDLQRERNFKKFRDDTIKLEKSYREQLKALEDLLKRVEENRSTDLKTTLIGFKKDLDDSSYMPETIDKLKERVKVLESVDSANLADSYLFRWEKIPGDDDEKLIDFLKQKYGIDWAYTGKIKKSDDGRIIDIFSEDNNLSLVLNNKTMANLTCDDGRTDEFIVKTENGVLKIYNESSIRNHVKTVRSLAEAWGEYVGKDLESWNSEIDVPILIGNEPIGMLNVHSNEKNWFIDSDQAILQSFASRVAISILVHQQDVLNRIHKIEQKMTDDQRFESIASMIREGIREVAFLAGPEKTSKIFPLLYICKNPMRPQRLLKEKPFGGQFEPKLGEPASKEERELLKVVIRDKGLGFEAIEELDENPGEPIFIVRENVDDPVSKGSESARQHGVITTACLPLAFGGIIYGLLYIHIKERRHFFTKLEKETLTLFAAHAAIVLKNLKRRSKEKTYDELCGSKLIKDCIGIKSTCLGK